MSGNEGTERERDKEGLLKGHNKTFEGDGYVHDLDCGDDYIVVMNIYNFICIYFYVKTYKLCDFIT